ncbi:dTDP-4-dehydrorhamnose reductase [Parageobacillus thermoglucosidasius]|uniref:dTDP-4-dehydrorhamnose reductase n=1 Tax=Parageobacillus thermoglucosidasius TaxID=1426 RepID=UPI000B577F85|nr:dTDP-4-dehydrorhamnose reductase [Parageobacillus thermoglucosidasius]OUM90026.1 MAG: dTDP-4-dehydrorhamnose reductase [Parageobacillus thermoglucosidasius]
MKVVVTGAKGQLGTDLMHLLADRGFEAYGYGREELDITNFSQVKQVIHEINPDVVIHAAAYTKVDLAESEPDKAFLINAYGTRNVAVASEAVGAKLVYISTDYVFDGTANKPYDEFSPTNPLSVYGKSKLAGEQFVRDLHSRFFIVRTSWVFGKHGNNFVKTMLKLAREREELMVVNDQIGCPTYTADLANCLLELIQTEKYGIYHVSNSGHCSWYEFAKAIFEETGIIVKVNPCATKEFPRPAPRPAYSVFDHMGLRLNGFKELPNWRNSLKRFLENY